MAMSSADVDDSSVEMQLRIEEEQLPISRKESPSSGSHGANPNLLHGGEGGEGWAYDKAWAGLNVGLCVQLGGIGPDDFASHRLQASFYTIVAGTAFLLPSSVLVAALVYPRLAPRIRQQILTVSTILAGVAAWMKPFVSSH